MNLLTAFVAASVVGAFQDTLDRLVALAVFLPVLAGQSGNTGCQALAVVLRGISLGELEPSRARAVVAKEALLGCINGALVGVTAGARHVPVRALSAQRGRAHAGARGAARDGGQLVPLALRRAPTRHRLQHFSDHRHRRGQHGAFLALATWLIL